MCNESDTLCAICLGSLSDEPSTKMPDCSHTYHTECILKWLTQEEIDNSCPLCRTHSDTIELMPMNERVEYIGSCYRKSGHESEEAKIVEKHNCTKKKLEVYESRIDAFIKENKTVFRKSKRMRKKYNRMLTTLRRQRNRILALPIPETEFIRLRIPDTSVEGSVSLRTHHS